MTPLNLAPGPDGGLPTVPTCATAPRGGVNGPSGGPKVGPEPGATLGAGPIRLVPTAAGQVAAAQLRGEPALR